MSKNQYSSDEDEDNFPQEEEEEDHFDEIHDMYIDMEKFVNQNGLLILDWFNFKFVDFYKFCIEHRVIENEEN